MARSQSVRPVSLSPAARQDTRDILVWSLGKFGTAAEARYRALLIQTLRNIEVDPVRVGSKARPELAADVRTYHLAWSRSSVESTRVKAPRRFILYRIHPARLQVARFLHESRDLARHLPVDYRAE